MSSHAFILYADDAWRELDAQHNSACTDEVRRELVAAVEGAELRGMTLGIVSRLTYRYVSRVLCHTFGQAFLQRFAVVISSQDLRFGSCDTRLLRTALSLIGVPAHQAIAVVSNNLEASAVVQAGLPRSWLLLDD